MANLETPIKFLLVFFPYIGLSEHKSFTPVYHFLINFIVIYTYIQYIHT